MTKALSTLGSQEGPLPVMSVAELGKVNTGKAKDQQNEYRSMKILLINTRFNNQIQLTHEQQGFELLGSINTDFFQYL